MFLPNENKGFLEMSDNRMAFYVPGHTNILDVAIKGDDGIFGGAYGRKTLKEYMKTEPTVELISLEEACDRIDKINNERFTTIEEITQEKWEEMLYVLPPLSYGTHNGMITFLLVEAITGSWHSCYVNIGNKYYAGYSNISNERISTRVERFAAFVNHNMSMTA